MNGARLPAALGWAAAALLAASLALPYWQARLFAPQYRQGLTATMYAFKVTGDVGEIDGLNHYIGMRKLGRMAVVERAVAVPAVLALAALCAFAFWRGGPRLRLLAAAGAAAFPVCFVADMAFWMRWASSHLDPTAPLKLKPFSIPFIGVGRVAQFRSELQPLAGFYLALAAAFLVFEAYRRSRSGRPLAAVAALALLSLPGTARSEWLQARLDSAPPGAVIDLAPGVYAAPLLIAKPVTLRGGGRATLSAGGKGTVVRVTAPGVVLEDLAVADSGESLLFEDAGLRVEAASVSVRRCSFSNVLFGAFLVHAPGALIEDSRFTGKPLTIGSRGDLIRSWNSDHVVVRRNTLEGGRDFVLWFSTGSRVEGNTVSNGRYGLHFMYTDGASVEGNRFLGNSVGLYVMYSQRVAIRANRFERHRGPSGAGLGLKESDWITVEENDFVGNRQGVYIDGSPLLAERGNVFARNVLARNDVGMSILPGVKGNAFYGNVFEDNLQQVSLRGGGRLTGNAWEKDGRGNFWSDYAGYGAAGSAVGRMAYRVESGWEGLMDRRPLARFFLFTPAAEAVDLASRAFPVFRPKAVLSDEHPLLRPPVAMTRSETVRRARWEVPVGLGALSGLLLGAPGLLRRRREAKAVARAVGPALRVRGLRKSFGGRQVLSGVDLELAAGRTLVLWGPNGAGKSTLLKCLLGLHAFEGEARVFGHDARTDGVAARASLGYAAQEFAGYEWTVREAMDFIADLRGLDRAAMPGVLARCGLTGAEDKRVPDLSGGMKQKLALAQALAAEPPLLILDEPCSNLDAASRADLLRILRELKGGPAIVLTTHRASEAAALADEVLWLEEGRPARLMGVPEFLRLSSGGEA